MSRSLLTVTQGLRFGAMCLNTAMQPRLLLLPISFHGLTTATVGTLNSVIQPLQKTQNLSARLVLLAPVTTTQHLSWKKKLHWLPISERIKYKVACMCFSAVNGSGLVYLPEQLHVYTPCLTLRSSDTRMLIQQCKRKTRGFRTFPCFGPHVWNLVSLLNPFN